jgi:hypothetical protein
MPNPNPAQFYFDVLKRITCYQSVAHLRKHSEKEWGLDFEEALAGAYENVIDDARRAIRGKRRPANAAVTREREAEAVGTVPCGQADPVEF